jgi:hypothetical protein
MARQLSRVQKKARSIPLQEQSAVLLLALNGELLGPMLKSRKLVDPRVLLLLVRRLQLLEGVLADRSIPLVSRGAEGEIVDSQVLLSKFRAVNRLLKRYSAVPVVNPDYFSGGVQLSRGWHLEWHPSGKRPRTLLELGYAMQIVEIARAGRISSLKQCANCGKWLFAGFSHQRFCNEICKETFHQTNEADKKRRREWAKHNYWLHKNRNIK